MAIIIRIIDSFMYYVLLSLKKRIINKEDNIMIYLL
jgi:hypothetical protein